MAGIGVRLNRIFEKNTLTTNLVGFFYSTVVTVAPMFVIIINLILMEYLLDFASVGYVTRELFSCTILYTFIFSLLTASPFNAVLSRYMSDVIYEERYQDILPCYHIGMLLNIGLSCLLGIPFCLWEHFVGKVPTAYVFCGFCGYISLVLVFYSMIYLSICKDYQRISQYFFFGMLVAFVLALILHFILKWETTWSMLFSLTIGFFVTATLENALIRRYFVRNSNHYRPVLQYFRKYWKLIFTNFLYILGLYIHNFVFWNTDLQMRVADTFVFAPAYDLATCLAMFTNLSSTIIFITRVEMHFHTRYKAYSEAVIGGRWEDIKNTKDRMFRQISAELMNLVRIQFIISTAVYLLCVVVLPQYGFSGRVMQIYPCLAAGYFILFILYAEIIFLYYFNDLTGAFLATLGFCLVTWAGSVLSAGGSDLWYGMGLVGGSFTGFTIGYFRLRFMERHMDEHIFCGGQLFTVKRERMPESMVYTKKQKER